MLVCSELRRQCKVGELPPERAEELLQRDACARARIANVEALALEILKLGDARLLADKHRHRLRVDRIDGAEVSKGVVLERSLPLEGLEVDIRLHQTEVELTRLERVDVEGGAAG